MSPRAVAVSTRAWIDGREAMSTVVVVTVNPASRITCAAASAFVLVQVGEHDVLAGADPPGDGLADRPGADDDDDVAHDELLSVSGVRRMVTSAAAGPTTVPTMRGP